MDKPLPPLSNALQVELKHLRALTSKARFGFGCILWFRPMTSEPDRVYVSVEEAARLAGGVSTGTIRNWVKSSLLPAETTGDTIRIAHTVLIEAKLLRETELLNLPAVKKAEVTEADVTKAIVERIVSPTDAPDRRFSINDGAAIASWKKGEVPAAALAKTAVPEPLVRPAAVSQLSVPTEWMTDRSGRFQALLDYMLVHKDPARLPPTFWDTRTCPEFIPPVDVFRAWYGGLGRVEEFEDGPSWPVTAIATTAVWTLREGELVRLPPNDSFDSDEGHEHVAGGDPPEYAVMNLRYRELERAWREAWHQRRRELRAAGVDFDRLPEPIAHEGRDRRALIDRYHREYLTPAELPDWFWAVEECPPFVPPTGVAQFVYGECRLDPRTGEHRTEILHSGFWARSFGEPAPVFVSESSVTSVRGFFPKGTRPPEHAEANLRYDLAQQEWREEWRLRRVWLEGE